MTQEVKVSDEMPQFPTKECCDLHARRIPMPHCVLRPISVSKSADHFPEQEDTDDTA
jgi:hypothetical protein